MNTRRGLAKIIIISDAVCMENLNYIITANQVENLRIMCAD